MEKSNKNILNHVEGTKGKHENPSFSAQIATAGQNSADAVVNNKIIPLMINNNSQSMSALALCYLSFLTSYMHLSTTPEEVEKLDNRLDRFEKLLFSLIETEKENQKQLIEALKNINIQ